MNSLYIPYMGVIKIDSVALASIGLRQKSGRLGMDASPARVGRREFGHAWVKVIACATPAWEGTPTNSTNISLRESAGECGGQLFARPRAASKPGHPASHHTRAVSGTAWVSSVQRTEALSRTRGASVVRCVRIWRGVRVAFHELVKILCFCVFHKNILF